MTIRRKPQPFSWLREFNPGISELALHELAHKMDRGQSGNGRMRMIEDMTRHLGDKARLIANESAWEESFDIIEYCTHDVCWLGLKKEEW